MIVLVRMSAETSFLRTSAWPEPCVCCVLYTSSLCPPTGQRMAHSTSSGSVQAGTSGVTPQGGVRTRANSNSMSNLAGAPSLRAALRNPAPGGSNDNPPSTSSSTRDQPNGVIGSGANNRSSRARAGNTRDSIIPESNDAGSSLVSPSVPARSNSLANAASPSSGPPPGISSKCLWYVQRYCESMSSVMHLEIEPIR